jgi:hypothetical protein
MSCIFPVCYCTFVLLALSAFSLPFRLTVCPFDFPVSFPFVCLSIPHCFPFVNHFELLKDILLRLHIILCIFVLHFYSLCIIYSGLIIDFFDQFLHLLSVVRLFIVFSCYVFWLFFGITFRIFLSKRFFPKRTEYYLRSKTCERLS